MSFPKIIFETDNTNNDNNIASNIFDNNTSNSHQDTQVENLFNKNENDNEKPEETIINNKVNMIEQKPIKKEIPKIDNDNINNINLNQKYNNFDNGIVLNNPLLNEQNKAEDIFQEENNNNNIFNENKTNNKNDIFETEDNDDAEKIFGSGGNNDNDNNKNIFEPPKRPNVNNNKMPFNNNVNNHKNIQKVQPKPPKLNNKFNSPFGSQNQKMAKPNLSNNNFKQNNINEQLNNNENNIIFNNQNDDDVNNIFNNQNDNDNNKVDFEEKMDYNFNENNKNTKDNQQSLNNEIEKLDDEQTTQTYTSSFIDSSKNLYHNNLRNYKNKNNIEENSNQNMNINNNKRNYDNLNYIQDKNDEQKMNDNVNDTNSHFKFDSGLNNEQNTNSESYSFSSIDQDYVLLSSNDGQNILINNIYLLLNSYSENQLYDYYFPVSYSNKEIDFNKLSSMLSIILNNGNELNEPISHIVVNILKYIIEKKVNVNQVNILNNSDLKNRIIEILANNIRNENKGTISLNNLFNTEVLFNSLNNSNNSVYNYNITNDALTHPLDYVINLFNEKILNKNNILYIYMLLLNLKENEQNQSIGFEEYDFIFENFNIVLYILLKYFNDDIPKIKNICNLLLNSYSPKLNFCHFILLKCILSDYDIQDERYYGRIFISFLQFPTIEKLLVADIYNFILYTMSSQYKKVIAKSSILIKYKYSLVKQNYKKDQRLIILGQKIYENISQFGLISKNNYFKNYIKTSFYNNKNEINTEHNIQETTYNNNTINYNNNNNNEEVKNNINYNNNNKIDLDKNIDKKENKETGTQKENNDNGGLFSTLKYAFGFGSSESNNNNNKDGNGQHILTEEEKKRLSPEELWKIEHPGEPEIVYDPVLKRYKLRGKIYNDQEEVIQKKEKERPMVPPPKMKKPITQNNPPEPYLNNNDSNNFNGQDSNFNDGNIIQNNNLSNPSSNKINNPFAAAQFKKQPKPPQLNQKQRMNNLHNRYAVGYNK